MGQTRSKLLTKTSEQNVTGNFVVNSEQVLGLLMVSLSLYLQMVNNSFS